MNAKTIGDTVVYGFNIGGFFIVDNKDYGGMGFWFMVIGIIFCSFALGCLAQYQIEKTRKTSTTKWKWIG